MDEATISYWSLFWTAFSAIGGTLGAIATTAAVIVALWQTKYANRKKLKVEFNDNIFVMPANGPAIKKYEFVGITVTNIGNRNVCLQDWRVMLPNKKTAIIMYDKSMIAQQMADPWPRTLEPEQQDSQYWNKKLFVDFIQNEASQVKNKHRKLVWFVKDSTGRLYKTKSKKTIHQYLCEFSDSSKPSS